MKVPAPQQTLEPSDEQLPTDVPQEQPPMEEPKSDSPFQNQKFDAGIDVDEDADPKLYIQKLAGKLAQKLRDYNETTQDTDDINKFATNMIISASVPSMSQEDAQDVIKKVEDNIGKGQQDNVNTEPENQPEQAPVDNVPQEQPTQEQPPKMESVDNQSIDDLVNEIIAGVKPKPINSVNKKMPFKTPVFK